MTFPIASWWQNLNENYQRLILSILFSITVVILGYTIYYIFFKPTPGAPGTGNRALQPTTELPSSGQRQPALPGTEEPGTTNGALPISGYIPTTPPDQIANGNKTYASPLIYSGTKGTSLDSSGKINYYNELDGKFYTVDSLGNSEARSSQTFPNAKNITFSPNGNNAVIEFPDNTKIMYDFKNNRQYTLPSEAQDIQFSRASDQLAYEFITDNPDNNWLIVAKTTGESASAVEHIGTANIDDILVNWSPDNTKIAFFRKSNGLNSEEVFLVGQNQENFKSLKVNGRGFEGTWSPNGDKLVYTVYNPESGYRPELWVTQSGDENIGIGSKNLGIRTWTSKCAFADNKSIYCAVPLYLEEGTGIYPTLSEEVPDTIYKINPDTGFKQQIAIPTNSLGLGFYTVQKLMVSPDGSILYMTDSNGGVYEIRLK